MPEFIAEGKSSYTGSKLFEPLANRLDFPIDRLNFLVAQAVALFLAYAFRRITSHGRFSYGIRLAGCLMPGVCLGIFAYGRDIFHLVILGLLGYVTTTIADHRSVHRITLLIAFLYLSKIHLMRMLYDFGGYILDITGPAMIGVQKVTSVAFNIHDGFGRDDRELSDEQRKYAIKRKPTMLEYFAYLLSFQTLMAGPLVYYNDFMEFITEENFEKSVKEGQSRPSPSRIVLAKLATSFFLAFLVLAGQPLVPAERMGEDDFLSSNSFIAIVVYMVAATSAARFKYYLAWKLGETIANASGLGFRGYNEDGTANWDLASNMNVFQFETSLNFKAVVDNWNKTTGTWLRRTVYERTRRFRLLSTYSLSAIWHGFHPGYYLTFLSGALITETARLGRRNVRPFFMRNAALKFLYDAFTFMLTRIYVAYVTAPFVLLTLESSLKLYTRLYFFGHVQCLLALLAFPLIFKKQIATKTEQPQQPNHSPTIKTNGHANSIKNGLTPAINGKQKCN